MYQPKYYNKIDSEDLCGQTATYKQQQNTPSILLLLWYLILDYPKI